MEYPIYEEPIQEEKLLKGRGAQINPFNPYHDKNYIQEHIEGLDEEMITDRETLFFTEFPKKVLNKVDSPDVGMMYSINPYQGCEHGCIYCYARNSHNYWGFSAGLDFESRIIVKPNAPELLEKVFMNPKWEPYPIHISGNTDCYQPVERKMRITRRLLEVCLKFKNPLGMLTKNQLIARDIDILSELAKDRLVHTLISITGLKEEIRLKMEPRTASYPARLKTMEKIASAGIPIGVMIGPIIPGLNDDQLPDIMKAAADHGAHTATFTMIRLNGAIQQIFTDWVWKAFPDKAQRILSNIRSLHEGRLNDSRWGVRMRGDGELASVIHQMFYLMREKYMGDKPDFHYNLKAFRRPGQMTLDL